MLVLHGIQLRNNTLNKQYENKTLKMYQKENKKKKCKDMQEYVYHRAQN